MKKVTALFVAFALTGCAGFNPVSLLTDKPDVTAQVGAENTKQFVGVTAKREEKQEVEIQDSTVGKVESVKRKVESIKADTVQAERIEIHNESVSLPYIIAGAMTVWLAMALALAYLTRNKKGA